MFDDARQELADALTETESALPYSEAKDAISGGDLMAEQAIKQHATVEEIDGEKFVVQVGDGPRYDAGAPGGETASFATTTDDPEPSPDAGSDPSAGRSAPSEPAVVVDGDEKELHTINGLRMALEAPPGQLLAGAPTGQDFYGLAVLENDNELLAEERVPYRPIDLEYGNRDTEETVARLLGKGKNVYLEGESGTGKNLCFESICSTTNRMLPRVSFSAEISVFDFVGEKDYNEDGSYFIPGKAATSAIFGHTLLLDEGNMAEGDITSYLHAITEEPGRRELELRGTHITLRDLPEGETWDPERHLGKYIHPEFRVVATGNPQDYAGTKAQNDAFRSRFTVVEVPYPDKETEKEILIEQTGADESFADAICEVASVLREAKREDNAIQCPITFRDLRDIVDLAGPNQEWMDGYSAAMTVLRGQASLKQDKQYIKDTLQDEKGAF